MTAAELIAELRKQPQDTDVEIANEDGYGSRSISLVCVDRVTRGIALPHPKTYDVIVLSSGSEGW